MDIDSRGGGRANRGGRGGGGRGGGGGGGKICQFYLQGSCKKGSNCDFVHEKRNKQVCHQFQTGRCTYGNECKFSHETGDNQPQQKNGICNDYQRTGECRHGDRCWFDHVVGDRVLNKKDGKRPGGAGAGPLGGGGGGGALGGPLGGGGGGGGSKNELCRNFQKGKCKRGAQCPYIHSQNGGVGEQQVEPMEVQFVNFFLNSLCSNRDEFRTLIHSGTCLSINGALSVGNEKVLEALHGAPKIVNFSLAYTNAQVFPWGQSSAILIFSNGMVGVQSPLSVENYLFNSSFVIHQEGGNKYLMDNAILRFFLPQELHR